jgi:hypothetical protein
VIRYVEKYPHPGPRPPDPGPDLGTPNLNDVGSVWAARKTYVDRKRADAAWCAAMSRHLNAAAVDACFRDGWYRTDGGFFGRFDGAALAAYLAALGEPWPREVFP